MFKSKRLYVNIFVFGSFLFLPFVPWYVPFIVGIIYGWYAEYYELIFLGFLMDIMYSSPYAWGLIFTLMSALIITVLQMVKKRVRFYA